MAEELELSLDSDRASSLYLVLERGVDALIFQRNELRLIRAMPSDKRPEELKDDMVLDECIKLNTSLIEAGKEFHKETGEILMELENKQIPKQITKPIEWKKP